MIEHASCGPGTQTTLLAEALFEAIVEFARQLRWLGVDVSIVELTDGLRALRDADLLDRDRLRRLLQITMVKRAADVPTFQAAFDLLFPAAERAGGHDYLPQDVAAGAVPADELAAPDLLERLVSALRGQQRGSLGSLATEVITAYAGLGTSQVAGSERYYEYRIMRQLDLSALLQRAMRLDADAVPVALSKRLASAERQERLNELRAEIAAQLRGRLAEIHGLESSLSQLRDSVIDVDFLRAGPAELESMQAAVRPLARRLAATARRRRRVHSSGKLDVRRTMRRAVAAGGVPLDPAWHRRHRSRPRLLVLCDISGSVAEFAKFTLSLLHALHAELPRLRSFVFTDGLAEVTDLVESSPGVIDTRLLLSRPGVVRGDGHSDYGSVLRHFLDEHAAGISPDSLVIICGDARANYRPERADLLRTLHRRVRAIHWLNPEPTGNWDTADSRISEYAPYCDSVTEMRTLRQLSDWVDTLL
jgi:uncharacterized protein